MAEFQPEQIWLFGSHAWGEPTAGSDVDLLVVVPHSDETPIRRSQRARHCFRGLRMSEDVLVETRQEVNRVKESQTSLENARRAATGEPPFYDIAVYHCQQSAKKAVKAFLVYNGKPLQKTHDIAVLVDLASVIEPKSSQLTVAAIPMPLSPSSHCQMNAKKPFNLRSRFTIS